MTNITPLIDFHCHLHDKDFDNDRDMIIKNMQEKNIYTITIGTDIVESRNAVKLASQNYNIYASIGVHPADIRNAVFNEIEFQELIDEYNNLEKYKKKNIVSIGECGLDYYQLNKIFGTAEEIFKEKNRQKDLFKKQISFAIKNHLPLMIHGRADKGVDAYLDIIDILKDYKDRLRLPCAGNMHFFVGNDKNVVQDLLEMDFVFSIGGVLTITDEYNELYKYIPINKINVETDSPYVVPKNKDGIKVGRRNSPENIEIIIEKLAEIRNIDIMELKNILLENSKKSYNIML